MEAILDLATHGTKLSKKAGRNKAAAQRTEEALGTVEMVLQCTLYLPRMLGSSLLIGSLV